jgi:hypothetical protein
MKTTELIPAQLEAFKTEIKYLKGTPATDENRRAGKDIIYHHMSRLQMLDLTLSQDDARAILATAYKSI